MKKIVKGVFLLAITSLLVLPTTTVEAKTETLQDYINLLNKYQADLKKNNAEIGQAEKNIENAKNEIENIKQELVNMSNEVQQRKEEIVQYNNDIKDKSLQTKQLFEYLQVANGENLYLEYAFGAETITDLIYRMSVVKQLAEYNDNAIKELETMIKKNEDRQVELAQKEKDMDSRQKSLEKKIVDLTGLKASLNENSVSVKQQVQIYKDIVEGYKKEGCQPSDVIGRDCALQTSTAGWKRPIQSGYVTSEFGYRWGSLHRAIDVSNKNPYNTKIYPVANGKIQAKFNDSYGALTVVIQHRMPGGQYYSSLYTHLSKYAPNIYVGKNVTTNDYIGYMGATGFAYGPHLHLEIAPCRAFDQADRNCGTWNNYVNFVKRQYDSGKFKGPRDLIYFPKSGVTFNGR